MRKAGIDVEADVSNIAQFAVHIPWEMLVGH